MKSDFNTWREVFISFCKDTEGQLSIVKNPSVGDSSNFYTAKINYLNDIVLIQNVVSSGIDIGPSYLILEAKYQNVNNLYINLTDRDLFDKLFSRDRILCGNKELDNRFSIRSSDRKLALNLFSSDRMQQLFLKNCFLIFNVTTLKGLTSIKLKNMEKKIYSKEELLFYLNEFRFIVKTIKSNM